MSSDAHIDSTSGGVILNDVAPERYEVLRHPRRVRLLEILEDRPSLSVEALTSALAERERSDVTGGRSRREIRVTLVHNHLPRLAEFGIVEWDDDRVELVADSPVCPDELSRLLEESNGDAAHLEQLVDPVRLAVLEEVTESDRPLSLEQLASALAGRGSLSQTDPERAEIALHHSHLPALEEIGALEYDHESGLVSRPDDAV
ncbi:DUF7344 domain-containing protein [Natrarchaeobius oligotrophus]|uniref:ArsR family transcriptional regulator n=1 Tax=Natrarchaeobius chitinivorans TaxID=1679083 RepID=A0A3N6MV84_NATCH|nr:ArsR family transcriptional regulator [Natrarchaeobius chitinivorans]RQG98806.1 ArsR family transcriptional regulator [Natrarchaeobius chitinivorans]